MIGSSTIIALRRGALRVTMHGDIARVGKSADDRVVARRGRKALFLEAQRRRDAETTIDVAHGTPKSITMPSLMAQGRMTRVAHEHRHDHASHEESKTARGGVTIEDAHQDPSHAADVIYTCPMHPQIRQVGPGNCPICGMTLEPLVASTEAEPNAELIDMTRRFWIGTGVDGAGAGRWRWAAIFSIFIT